MMRSGASGRLRSSYYRALLRAQQAEGGLLRLDEIANGPTRYPFGTAAYLYGSHLLQFAAKRHGEEALARMTHDYGTRPLPYALNWSAEEALGAR